MSEGEPKEELNSSRGFCERNEGREPGRQPAPAIPGDAECSRIQPRIGVTQVGVVKKVEEIGSHGCLYPVVARKPERAADGQIDIIETRSTERVAAGISQLSAQRVLKQSAVD